MSNAATAQAADSTADREIVLERDLDAPRHLVFKAYTDSEHIAEWWGPDGFTTTVHEMDVRPGGVWRFDMLGPDGTNYPNRVVYQEVVSPERLVYLHGATDDEPEDQRFHVTITLAEHGNGTRITQRMLFSTTEARDFTVGFGAIELGQQTLAKLAAYLRR